MTETFLTRNNSYVWTHFSFDETPIGSMRWQNGQVTTMQHNIICGINTKTHNNESKHSEVHGPRTRSPGRQNSFSTPCNIVPQFSFLAVSTPAFWCRCFFSRNFHPCVFDCAVVSCLAFSVDPIDLRFSYVCALHCAQLLHTILHRTDLVISLLASNQSSCSDDVYLREGDAW